MTLSASRPTGRVAEVFHSIQGEGATWVVEACKAPGFRYSPRLHVMLWGARRGV